MTPTASTTFAESGIKEAGGRARLQILRAVKMSLGRHTVFFYAIIQA
jgi:hypothetical protein